MPDLPEQAWLAHAVPVRGFSALSGQGYLYLGDSVVNQSLWFQLGLWKENQ